MTATVATLEGPVEVDRLGLTLMHEHLFVSSTEVTRNFSDTWQSDEIRVADAATKLRTAYDAGVRTVVDLTVVGIGRDIDLMSRAASLTGVNVVAATGVYTLERLPYQLQFTAPGMPLGGPDRLAEWFVRDLTEGIAGTPIRAAVLKCATDVAGLTDDVVRVLRATARAHLETGAPIMTHTDAHTRRGEDQLRVLVEEEGVDPRSLVIGHCGDSTDLDYLRGLMDTGASIGMDRFGQETALATRDRVDVVARLCALGYADRMVLSHDAACHSEWVDQTAVAEKCPEWDFTYIPRAVVPRLLEAGIDQADVDRMLVGNPRRILGREAAAGAGR